MSTRILDRYVISLTPHLNSGESIELETIFQDSGPMKEYDPEQEIFMTFQLTLNSHGNCAYFLVAAGFEPETLRHVADEIERTRNQLIAQAKHGTPT